ncbi:hypothetical protein NT01EI_0496 [Edwardsiella ictaluri 93-146]|uniref:Uncharacterized protein n=1 Tax=Edwardsiella ictaluri (strain 93-146) TaxID=634503 RepID=C5BH48_EDWI9|nr:hypothetical protein NT01EI_0496 [Edwardsiella ictaluri 93-146]
MPGVISIGLGEVARYDSSATDIGLCDRLSPTVFNSFVELKVEHHHR